MGAINFYLKKAEKTTGRSLIYLKHKYNGLVLVWSTKQTIDPKNWISEKQRVKNNKLTTADGEHFINDMLDTVTQVLKRAYNSEIKNGIPQPNILKRYLDEFMHQNKKDENQPSFMKLLERFIAGEIKHKGNEKSGNTIKTYNTLKGHLEAYQKEKKVVVDYHTIDLNFLYKYITFLRAPRIDKEGKQKAGLGQNAIAKDIQIIKTVMKKAVTLGESKNLWHEHEEFAASREETDAVYLTENEITDLYQYDFSHNRRLEQTRDLFVFGCFVGLRFSDYSTVKPEYIVKVEGELFIKMITKKTNELVIIPCHPIVLEIFEKYKDSHNKLPKSISNQKFNEAIKDVCKEAGLTETGRLATEPGKELYKCISSHTCRRSFATNYYLQGFPVIDLMRITAHKTDKAFLKYIRVTKLDSAKRLAAHIRMRWSEKILKVV